MFKKILVIFGRDFRVNTRDALALYLLIIPILFSFGINALSPSINDTTISLALIKDDNPAMEAYLENFANVELYSDISSAIDRVERRDNVVAILPEDGNYYILTQGNEPESILTYSKVLKTYFEENVQIEDTNAEILDFGKSMPPLKKMLVNISIMFLSVLGGMLIAINIVEEKIDNTISAINVTPVSRQAFIFGKSLMGLILPIYGSVTMLLITGFMGINLGQALMIIIASCIISLLIGFIEGINNDDVMTAAAGIKMLFLPIGAAVAGFELLSDKWQFLFYWLPFYWAYKGNDAILMQTASWLQVLLYTGIILLISGALYLLLAPKIRKGLE